MNYLRRLAAVRNLEFIADYKENNSIRYCIWDMVLGIIVYLDVFFASQSLGVYFILRVGRIEYEQGSEKFRCI